MLTDDMQLIALKNALQGKPLAYAANFFSGDAAKVAKVIEWAQRTGQDTIKSLEPLVMTDTGVSELIGSIPGNHPLARRKPSVPLIDQEVEEVKWLYEGYLLRGQINSFVADASVGKTWVGLDLALKVCNGLYWPNMGVGVHCQKPGKVLWIDGENFKSANRYRIAQWAKANLYPSVSNLHYCEPDPTRPFFLDDKATQDEIVQLVDELEPSLVIFDAWDTLTEENTFGSHVRAPLNFIDQLAKAYDLTPLILAHPAKRKWATPTTPISPDDAAGSRLFKGRTRMMYGMWFAKVGEESKSTDPRIVKAIKHNNAPPKHPKLMLNFQPLHPSGLMLEYMPYDPVFEETDKPKASHDDDILEAIDTLENPTTAEIARHLGVNAGQVSKWTAKLERLGEISREEGKGNPWQRA